PRVGPRLVRPPEAERKVGLAAREHLRARPVQEPSTTEPVVPVAEPLEAGAPGQFGLRAPALGETEVVEPEVGRDPRLTVSAEEARRGRDGCPLGEAGTPPTVV